MKSTIFKRFALALVLSVPAMAWSQVYGNDYMLDWKEGAVPPPPAFNVDKLLTFDVSSGSSMVYGVDPATLSITPDDIVRYVIVATSPSGVRNAFYEGIRCLSGEYKTYARHTPGGGWVNVTNPEWKTMFGNMPSRHALQFAKTAACDNVAPAGSVREIVEHLKSWKFNR
jgi:hypothetical protein